MEAEAEARVDARLPLFRANPKEDRNMVLFCLCCLWIVVDYVCCNCEEDLMDDVEQCDRINRRIDWHAERRDNLLESIANNVDP